MRLSGESRALFFPGFISRLPKPARFSAALRLHLGAHPDRPVIWSKARFHVVATRVRASFGKAAAKPGRDGPQNRGERSAERRLCLVPRLRGAAATTTHPPPLAREGREGAARLPALHSDACQSERTLRLSPGRASRDRQATRALSAPSIALKRNTPRAGRDAGGIDAQAARERGYKPRPREPHPLHQSAVTGRRPSMSEMVGVIVIAAAKSKGFKFSSINQCVSRRRFPQKRTPRA